MIVSAVTLFTLAVASHAYYLDPYGYTDSPNYDYGSVRPIPGAKTRSPRGRNPGLARGEPTLKTMIATAQTNNSRRLDGVVRPGNIAISGNESRRGNRWRPRNEVRKGNVQVQGSVQRLGNVRRPGNDVRSGNLQRSDNAQRLDNAQRQGIRNIRIPANALRSGTVQRPGNLQRSGNGVRSGSVPHQGNAFRPNSLRPGHVQKFGNTLRPGSVQRPANEVRPGNVRRSGNVQRQINVQRSGNVKRSGNIQRPGNTQRPGNVQRPGNEQRPGNVQRSGNVQRPRNVQRSGNGQTRYTRNNIIDPDIINALSLIGLTFNDIATVGNAPMAGGVQKPGNEQLAGNGMTIDNVQNTGSNQIVQQPASPDTHRYILERPSHPLEQHQPQQPGLNVMDLQLPQPRVHSVRQRLPRTPMKQHAKQTQDHHRLIEQALKSVDHFPQYNGLGNEGHDKPVVLYLGANEHQMLSGLGYQSNSPGSLIFLGGDMHSSRNAHNKIISASILPTGHTHHTYHTNPTKPARTAQLQHLAQPAQIFIVGEKGNGLVGGSSTLGSPVDLSHFLRQSASHTRTSGSASGPGSAAIASLGTVASPTAVTHHTAAIASPKKTAKKVVDRDPVDLDYTNMMTIANSTPEQFNRYYERLMRMQWLADLELPGGFNMNKFTGASKAGSGTTAAATSAAPVPHVVDGFMNMHMYDMAF